MYIAKRFHRAKKQNSVGTGIAALEPGTIDGVGDGGGGNGRR
jgi:hypothetical protein